MTPKVGHVGRGGATDFKVGGAKQDSRAERAKKNFCTPHFSNCGGYTQANISTVQYNTVQYCIVLHVKYTCRAYLNLTCSQKLMGASLIYHAEA